MDSDDDIDYDYEGMSTPELIEVAVAKSDVKWLDDYLRHYTGDLEKAVSLLTMSCVRGQLIVVEWLMEHTDVRNSADVLGEALGLASWEGQWNIVRWLLVNTQPEVNIYDCVLDENHVRTSDFHDREDTPLHSVIWRSRHDLRLPTPFLISCCMSGGTMELCRLVDMCNENVNVRDEDGNTPLHWACTNDSSDAVGALLLAGADNNLANDTGKTAWQWVSRKGYVEKLKLMDVSSEWKKLTRTHRLRRRAAVRVMMTLIKWRVKHTNMWATATMKLHLMLTCAMYKYRNNYQRMYSPRLKY